MKQKSRSELLFEAQTLGLDLNYEPEVIMSDIRLLPSEYWHASRKTGWGGSDEGALSGKSHYTNLTNKCAEKILNEAPSVDNDKQFIFDYGHVMESLLLKRYADIGGYKLICYQNYFVIVETTNNLHNEDSRFVEAEKGIYSFVTRNKEEAEDALKAISAKYPNAKLIEEETNEPKDIRDITDEEHLEYDDQGIVCVDRRQYRHPLYPHMIGDCDGLCLTPFGEKIGLECKTYSHQMKGSFTDGVYGDPGVLIKNLEYEDQVRHYMSVLNIDRFDLIASCGNTTNDVTVNVFYRDLEYEKEICERCEQMWTDYIDKNIIPEAEPMNKDSFNDLLEINIKAKKLNKDNTHTINNPNVQELIEEIEVLTEKCKLKGSEKDLLENQINKKRYEVFEQMEGFKDVILLTDDSKDTNYTISVKENCTPIDKKMLQLRYPNIYKEIYGGKSDSDLLKEKYPSVYQECTKKEISSRGIGFRKSKK